VDIAKMFAFFCKNRFLGRKTHFLQKSYQISAKFPKAFCENRFPRKTYFPILANFSAAFRFLCFFTKIGVFAKIGVFLQKVLKIFPFSRKSAFFAKNTLKMARKLAFFAKNTLKMAFCKNWHFSRKLAFFVKNTLKMAFLQKLAFLQKIL
jgi:hypothetical protein